MKIIEITDDLNSGGGVNSFVFDLCETMAEKGYDVHLIGILDSKMDIDLINKFCRSGVSVSCLGARSKKDAIRRFIPKLRNSIIEISGGEKTILNLHLKLSVLLGAIVSATLSNVICIETYHNTYHNYHLQYLLCYPLIKKYICVSNTAKEEMHRRFFTPYYKLISIPNGISRNKIRSQVTLEIDEYSHIPSKLTILSVGRLSYEKNFKTSISAYIKAKLDNTEYVIIGDGPQREEIEEIIKLEPSVIMKGNLPRKEVIQYIKETNLIIMPSLWEGRSIFLLEAMCFDIPLILSDVPGLREIFSEKELEENELYRRTKFGYIVQPTNCDAYILAIKDFMNLSVYDINEIRMYIKSVSESCDIQNVVEEYISCFKNNIDN